MTVSTLNDALLKIEEMVRKLPGPVQHAILNEIRPLRELFLEQRPPRILLMGDPEIPESMLMRALFGRVVSGDDSTVSIKPLGPAWFEFRRDGRGATQVMDLRTAESGDLNSAMKSLSTTPPDVVVYLQGAQRETDICAQNLERVEKLMGQIERSAPGRKVSLLGMAIADQGPLEDVRWKTQSMLFSRMGLADRTVLVEAFHRSTITGAVGTPDGGAEFQGFLAAMCEALPNAAKVEMARITGLKKVQSAIAALLIRSCTAVCGAVGTQPIPLADLPILTSIQAAMVAGIIHLSGRELKMKLAVEFLAALGLNVGLGMVFREGTRAVVKLIPGWGNAISGMVAAGGTFAIGRAATAYFIDGVSLELTRKIFRRRAKDLKQQQGKLEPPR